MEVDLHYMGYAITHYFKHAFIWIAKWVNPENLTWCLFSPYLLRQTPKVRINTGREPQAFTHSYKQWTQHKLWFPADTGKKAAANVPPHLRPEWLYEKRFTFLLTNLAPSETLKEGKLQNRCDQAESHSTPAILTSIWDFEPKSHNTRYKYCCIQTFETNTKQWSCFSCNYCTPLKIVFNHFKAQRHPSR